MTDTIQILAQGAPSANILTAFYTVPALTSIVVSSIVICNVSNASDQFSISMAVGGASDSLEQYIYYGTPLDISDTFIATIGITLAATDEIRILSKNGGLSFNLFGVAIT